MKTSARIEIIIVTYNSAGIIRGCLESLYSKSTNIVFDTTVVDNDSHDGTTDIIEQYFPDVKLIKNHTNAGFGSANNLALRESTAEFVFLLNPDILLLNDAIEILTKFMDEHQEAAVCGCNLFSEVMEPQPCYGHFPSLNQIFWEQLLKNIFREHYKKHFSLITKNDSSVPLVVDYVSGSNMFIRRKILDQVGYFDEDFFLYYEETELTFRINKQGYKIFLVPKAKLIHIGGTSLNMDESKKYCIFKKSILILLHELFA